MIFSINGKSLQKIDRLVNMAYLLLLAVYFFFHALSKVSIFTRNLTFQGVVVAVIHLCIVLIVFITIYHIVTFEFSKKWTIVLLAFFCILVAQYLISRDGTLLILYCFTLCSKNYNSNKLIKWLFYIYLFSFLFVIFGSLINIFPNIKFTRASGETRYTLGFWVPNVSSYYLVILTSLYLLIKNDKIKNYHFVILAIINFVFYKLTDTKNGLFATMIAIALTTIAKYLNSKLIKRIIGIVSCCSFFFCATISFLLTYLYSNYPEKLSNLNRILSGRLSLQLAAIKKYGVPLFGRLIVHDTQKYDVIDSSYFTLLLVYGIILLLFMLLFFTFEGYLFVKTNNILLSICLLTLAYHSTFDSPLLSTINNPYSIFIFASIYMLYPNACRSIIGREVAKVI